MVILFLGMSVVTNKKRQSVPRHSLSIKTPVASVARGLGPCLRRENFVGLYELLVQRYTYVWLQLGTFSLSFFFC
jgi:hypothetical protein